MTDATPRPWKFLRHGPDSRHFGNICGFFGKGEDGIKTCRTITVQLAYGTEEENAANAALIVRAVNSHEGLVDALEAILSDATGCIKDPDKRVWAIQTKNYRKALAALKAAEEK